MTGAASPPPCSRPVRTGPEDRKRKLRTIFLVTFTCVAQGTQPGPEDKGGQEVSALSHERVSGVTATSLGCGSRHIVCHLSVLGPAWPDPQVTLAVSPSHSAGVALGLPSQLLGAVT